MQILKHISLKELTTFKTGGAARFFAYVATVEDLESAVTFAKEKELPMFVLGGGSNILVSDAGFPGLVIKIEIKGIHGSKTHTNKTHAKKKAKNAFQEIVVGAGENWDEFVAYTVSQNLYGIENLSYIPGTVGAAPVQNIGAYGTEVDTVISWIEAFNTETNEIELLQKDACQFSYRDSVFKKPDGKKYIITRVAFILSKDKKLTTSYKDIAEYIKNNNLEEQDLTQEKIREMVIEIRKKKLPDVFAPDALGTAGSFFKNPIISKEEYENLLKRYPDMPSFPLAFVASAKEASLSREGAGGGEFVKIPAAWLLDKLCNFKGYREGNVGVYKNQALVLINFGGATSEEILKLAQKMIECVKEKTGIILEQEVQAVV